MNKYPLSIFVSLSLGATAAAAAAAPLAQVKNIWTSPACGRVQSDVLNLPEYDEPGQNISGEALRVFFDDFHLDASSATKTRKDCQLNATVEVPAGYRFRALLASAEGSYSIGPQGMSKGGIEVSYTVNPLNLRAEQNNRQKPWTGNGDFTCVAKLEDQRFSLCANHPTQIKLDTNLAFWLEQADGGFSSIQLDATNQKTDLIWKWQLMPCINLFEGRTFNSFFKLGPNRTQKIRLSFYEYGGQLLAEDGTKGSISGLSYSDDGTRVSGNWQLGDKSGTFKFSSSEEDPYTFKGELASGSKTGTWFGNLEF